LNKKEKEILKKARSEIESWRDAYNRIEKVKEKITKKMAFYRNIVKSLVDINWNCGEDFLMNRIVEALLEKRRKDMDTLTELEEEVGILEENQRMR